MNETPPFAEQWDAIVRELKNDAQHMHEAREAGLTLCRKLTQLSARCIRHVHRHQFDEAQRLLGEAREVATQARDALSPHPSLFHAGYLHDAEKERVEAAAVLAIVLGQAYPTPQELGVETMTYLNGMGEASSECRRFALDEMRSGRVEGAETILARMETIYEDLIGFDYADSLTHGLRRTCDALRAVVERTRSDLTTTQSHQTLVQELRRTREALGAEDARPA
ncbi:MAG: hypothetical protein KIS66_02815 [Fimbriimonadaceae bacterium]|nr:hypothetical protein [Fimbriimonadaceae bacterium]